MHVNDPTRSPGQALFLNIAENRKQIMTLGRTLFLTITSISNIGCVLLVFLFVRYYMSCITSLL